MDFDPKMYAGLLQRAKFLYECQRDGVIPYAEAIVEAEKGDYWFKKGNYCTHCVYSSFCFENKEEIKSGGDDND